MTIEPDLGAARRAPRSRSHSGERVGHYLVSELIGRGAGGEVYRADHLYLRRKVAVKFVQPRERGGVDRFLDEARAMAGVRHPGLVEIYDCALLPGDGAWLAMELLEGELLAARLANGPKLGLPEIVDIVAQLADALEVVHDAGLVHRDLKPSNIFLTEERGSLRVKLLDFGVAKRLGPSPARTEPGALLGTPYYMSPEQCRGEPTIDRRSDVYSLGAVLFELATGQTPFVGTTVAELIEAHLYREPPLLGGLAPELPAIVGEVAACALAKSPDDRYPCALALAKALAAAQAPTEATRRERPATERMKAAPVERPAEEPLPAIVVERPRATRSYMERPLLRFKPRSVTTTMMPAIAAPLPRPTEPMLEVRIPRVQIWVTWALVGLAIVLSGILAGVLLSQSAARNAAVPPAPPAPYTIERRALNPPLPPVAVAAPPVAVAAPPVAVAAPPVAVAAPPVAVAAPPPHRRRVADVPDEREESAPPSPAADAAKAKTPGLLDPFN